MAKDEVDKRVRAAAATLELAHLLERRPRELSGGQRQRVAMGRAIVRNPKVFLFDEPLSNLDAKLRGQMRVQIKNLQRSIGVTSVYVTHDQLEAMTMADILVVMNAGRIEQAGAPLDVYARPASTFVASFIGAPPMNLVPVAGNEAFGGGAGAKPPAGATTVGFRPEDATTIADKSGAPTPAGTLVLDAVVEGVEPVGAESFLHCKTAGTIVILRVPGRTVCQPGDRLVVRVAPDHLHWFDVDGRRLGD
jgi:sn-glycerol 3-phosphate transport system ATP-binding protein